jgi:adenine-specific DNA-methyltransferase
VSGELSIRQVLGVLNSRLMSYYYQNEFKEKADSFAQVKVNKLRKLPIPKPSKKVELEIEAHVREVLAAKQRDAGADTSALERETDELVYALYGLTPEEIQIVEGAAK